MYQLNYISDTEYQSALEDKVYARIANKTAQGRKNSVYSYFTDAVITKVVSDLQEQKDIHSLRLISLFIVEDFVFIPRKIPSCKRFADSVINNPDNYPVDTKFSLEYKLQVT